MGLGALWKTIVTEHNLLLHPEMQLDNLLHKMENMHQFSAETPPRSLGLSSCQMTRRQWKRILLSISPRFGLFSGKTDVSFCVQSMKKSTETVISERCNV